MLSVYSWTVLGLSAKLLVSQGWASTTYSCNLDLVLSSHCSFLRTSVRLAQSLLEHLRLTQWSVNELVVPYVQEDHQLTSCLSILFHTCGHLEKVCSMPLCASDVQYSQEFHVPGQHIRDLNCCAAKSWLLCLISPTPCSFHHCTHQGPPNRTNPQTLRGDYLGLGLISLHKLFFPQAQITKYHKGP